MNHESSNSGYREMPDLQMAHYGQDNRHQRHDRNQMPELPQSRNRRSFTPSHCEIPQSKRNRNTVQMVTTE